MRRSEEAPAHWSVRVPGEWLAGGEGGGDQRLADERGVRDAAVEPLVGPLGAFGASGSSGLSGVFGPFVRAGSVVRAEPVGTGQAGRAKRHVRARSGRAASEWRDPAASRRPRRRGRLTVRAFGGSVVRDTGLISIRSALSDGRSSPVPVASIAEP